MRVTSVLAGAAALAGSVSAKEMAVNEVLAHGMLDTCNHRSTV